ncbi:MAG TPA: 2-phospho-L-lactate transferase CofD family protein [Acidobacteriota bacterium]|nr:2-phospho-L-lactate transferase CofD family protein [Acidobacteriota bacterium]
MTRTPVEHLVEYVLNGTAIGLDAPNDLKSMARAAASLNVRDTRVVILGGGTGLSTVVGGNSQLADWADHPFVGLKQEFSHLDVVVCTTDDGGSTGRLLKHLPMIAIGDLRKSCISLVRPENLRKRYGLEGGRSELVRLIQQIFNYRFAKGGSDIILQDPLLAAAPELREFCPRPLAVALRILGRYVSSPGAGPVLDTSGHCLGNLLLTAAVFAAAKGRRDRPPSRRAIQTGLDRIAALIGATPGQLHAATSTPGQLRYQYANGVEVYGQSKSSAARRGFPVEFCTAEFAGVPKISQDVLRAIRTADLIIYAPGSLYSSIIPLLQLRPITAAIRRNRTALKILGANAWIQEGETDLSLRNEGRGFLVSELIDAYDRNVPGGAGGLFDIVLSTNLERLPGNILRNYALEGKSPIHLDRVRVEAMGFEPVEATLFSPEEERQAQFIHHDARRFALAIRTLWFARHSLYRSKSLRKRRSGASKHGRVRSARASAGSPILCDYLSSIRNALHDKDFQPSSFGDVLVDLAWENRDIKPEHLGFFRGTKIVPARNWDRSTEWDNVLGYFDPADRYLKLHESLHARPSHLRDNLLIALGESLLGRYAKGNRWLGNSCLKTIGARCYEIALRPPRERECFLSDAQLRHYLRLARMIPDPVDPTIFRITINSDEGFLPPGLLFGLTYAWYLNNLYAKPMEYEMALLRQDSESLIPHQAKERIHRQALIGFFREDIFGHRHE